MTGVTTTLDLVAEALQDPTTERWGAVQMAEHLRFVTGTEYDITALVNAMKSARSGVTASMGGDPA